MANYSCCFHKLAIAIFTAIAFCANSVDAQIVEDATLPNNSSITQQDNIKIIEGGSQAGTNLFHSFEQFSVPTDTTAYFNNPVNIQNIITRITGKSISNIDGIIRANGTANLFLINPNGIVFGENAALDIGGSFLATTASSINFADGKKFSATQPQTEPLLTVNVPVGLQFGSTAATIRNQSQAPADHKTNASREFVGLQVPTGKTLALVGGDVILEGGNLTVDSGRVELGSVGSNSLVSLNSIGEDWVLGYENVKNFQNIELIQRITDDSFVISSVRVDNTIGAGNIQIQGDLFQVIGFNVINLINQMDEGIVDVGNINITARKLVIQDGGGITSNAFGSISAPNIVVNARESVEVIGGFNFNNFYVPSNLSSSTTSVGKSGNLTINTNRLLVKNGGTISTNVAGEIQNFRFLEATGAAGNVIINASEVIEIVGTSAQGLRSSIGSEVFNSGDAGNVTISTKQLIVRDGGEVSVSSALPRLPANININEDASNLGNAGELNIIADNILLDNKGQIVSEAESANGGNVNLQLQDLLLMRRNSLISTNAGKAGFEGNGGNINISSDVIAALEDSDISANSEKLRGGNVNIVTQGIFGTQFRNQLTPGSDITATGVDSQSSGSVTIDGLQQNPAETLTQLPSLPVEREVYQACQPNDGNQSEFYFTGNGGLPLSPRDFLTSESVNLDWVSLPNQVNKARLIEKEKIKSQTQKRIVEATGWVIDKNGDVFFVASVPNTFSSSLNNPSCLNK